MNHGAMSVLLRFALSGLVVSVLCACSIGHRSPETRYYVLALPAASAPAEGARNVTGPRVGIGPVILSNYLDRQQIFIRQSNSTDVMLTEYDRWGEDLGDGVSRLLVESVSARLAAVGGTALPMRANVPLDWRIGVNVNRFDGAPGADVVLDADWGVYTPQGDILREGHFLAKAQSAPGIDGLVRAHGELLARFGDVLAEAARTAAAESGKRSKAKSPQGESRR